MSETISIHFPEISGDASDYTAFLYAEDGTLLNSGGDAIAEVGSSGVWTFTLAETRTVRANYFVRVYYGTTESAGNLVYHHVLYAGQTLVGQQFQASNVTLIRGTVGATSPTATSFTPSSLTVPGSVNNQFKRRVIVFDNDTVTEELRGQATDITASSSDTLPLLTFSALTTAPASGDTFSIV